MLKDKVYLSKWGCVSRLIVGGKSKLQNRACGMISLDQVSEPMCICLY